MQTDTDAHEVRLQAALRDVVALSAIAAAWIETEPDAVAAGLADTLISLLQLDFAFVRLRYRGGDGPGDVTRGSAWKHFPEWLERHAGTSAQFPGKALFADVGDGPEPCSGVAIAIGVNGDGGLVAAASTHRGFPTAIDQMLLSLAANHAATAFQNAHLIDERRRAEEQLRQARNDLEVKVGERTSELRVANDELAALRRVATLVAEAVQPGDLFAVVAEEVARVINVPLVSVIRFELDGTATECASFSPHGPLHPDGKDYSLEGTSVLQLVHESSKPARIDDYSALDGEIAEYARRSGLRSTVGVPVVVAGRVWGAMLVSTNSPHDALPQGTETRLADFTELLATAIENAESREALAQLADEQAALHRMATLVAQGVPPGEIFSAVCEEVGRLVGSETPAVVKFEHDPPAIVVVGVGVPGIPVGTRSDLDDGLASTEVYRTRRSARIDRTDWASASGPIHEPGRRLGLSSTVASPIIVDGRLWGTMSVSAPEPLALDTEERLERFTELVATAIANAESREALARLADEQATLRRMATLVAQGVPAREIFSAACEEVSRLVASETALVAKFERDPPGVVIVGAGPDVPGIQVGSRWDLDDAMASTEVYRTGRSARADRTDAASAPGPIHQIGRRLGLTSTVASPIIVDGRLWGTMSVAATGPFPPGTEQRVERFTELLGTAIANADSRSELAASRMRIVAAADEARRRIERDLHDGTQQRLVSLGLEVRAVEAQVPPDSSDLRLELSHVATGLADAVADLQEISRGIHPAILSKGGLGPALRALARRSAIPVEVDLTSDARLPEAIEAAAYYVASEALANAAKYSQASTIEVSLEPRDGNLVLSIRDDGVGGADPAGGSGLVGLTDRVEALGGSISVRSRPGEGTHITAELPLGLALPESSDAANLNS
jgi:signal transduction histidine kinase